MYPTEGPWFSRAYATYINAGLRASHFVGPCEVGTDGRRVWLKGKRVPLWVSGVRAVCYVLFAPLGFFTFMMLSDWVVGKKVEALYLGGPAVPTLVLVSVLMAGGDRWAARQARDDSVSWPATARSELQRTRVRKSIVDHLRPFSEANPAGPRCLVRGKVPLGPHGRLRRIALLAPETEGESLLRTLSGYPPVVTSITMEGPSMWQQPARREPVRDDGRGW
jgi:hypothetical protein